MQRHLVYQNRRQASNRVYYKDGVSTGERFTDDDMRAYNYFCLVKDPATGRNWLKTGKAIDVAKRMKQHANKYKTEVTLLWVSQAYSVYTALKAEKLFILLGKENLEWEYVRNDRFFVPEDCKVIEFTVRKTYLISLE